MLPRTPGFLLVCAAAVAAAGCATTPAPRAADTGPTLGTFSSEGELAAFLREHARRVPPPPAAPPPAPTAAAPDAPQATGGESVTNVQHAGVDEGGIVKVHGDHLVVLRRGRLFTVRIGDDELRPVAAVDAFGPGIDPGGAWYDELIVAGDRAIVIGYSYRRGGTEVGLFDVGADGSLRHHSTYQLRSADYYSSRNYASRLVEGKLVFYAPLPVPYGRTELEEVLPAMRRWEPGGEGGAFRPTATASRVYRPARSVEEMWDLALHTVTVCDPSGEALDCRATSVVGPRGRVFYVSPTAVHVWTVAWRGEREEAVAYRLPLDGSAPTALGVRGSPVDQFSFLESGDGHLNVLVRSGGRGEGMWGAERGAGGTALLRVPLAAFGDGRADAPEERYRPLPIPAGQSFQNRFVGAHLLYGTGTGWGRPEREVAGELYAVPWAGGEAARLPLPHGVDRIEALGSDAVVVGTDGRDLHFTSVSLGAEPAVAGRYVLAGASQGELRSHGFFYRPEGPRSGLLGLPVRGPGRPGYEHLFRESAAVLFLRNRGLTLAELGRLAARAEGAADDGCRASCVDWYGNARPLFLRGRVFALLGYELVEGELAGDRIRERRRVSYAPAAAAPAGR
ncbi:MAG TPA: beta-propeller domain-containing protein [Longimicrobiaceae bacterium]|nr:beta-propeller domain-containing protein [Longimicrobiaceae bacterium]